MKINVDFSLRYNRATLFIVLFSIFSPLWIGVKSILRESCDAPKLILLLSVQKHWKLKYTHLMGRGTGSKANAPKFPKFAYKIEPPKSFRGPYTHQYLPPIYIIYLVRFIIQFTKKNIITK